MRGINFDRGGLVTHNRPVNEPVRAWWADAVVWDNHACMPLRADDAFLPQLYSPEFRPLTKGLGPEFVKNPAAVASKSHIVGLAFVRATSMGELANALPTSDPRVPVLRRLAAIQAATGFPLMGAVGYDGSHYYASWATTYLITNPSR